MDAPSLTAHLALPRSRPAGLFTPVNYPPTSPPVIYPGGQGPGGRQPILPPTCNLATVQACHAQLRSELAACEDAVRNSGVCKVPTSVGCQDAIQACYSRFLQYSALCPAYAPCPPGESCCGDVGCTGSDPNNCGSCGVVCPPSAPECCQGTCTNTASDALNCGGCQQVCAAGEACCSGECTSITSDPSNCGQCDNVCPAPNSCCWNGVCYADAPASLNPGGSTGYVPNCNGSTSNYVLYNGCDDIEDLTVEMTVTGTLTALVTESPATCASKCACVYTGATPTQDGGFSLQLNAYPQPGQTDPNGVPIDWLQYILLIANNRASAQVQYWSPGGTVPVTSLGGLFGPLRSSNTFDSGSVLTIALTTIPVTANQGVVTSAKFTVTDVGGSPFGTVMYSTVVPLPQGAQYAMSAFEVVLVGPDCCSDSNFLAGGGATLTYSAAGPLCVQQGPGGAACGESRLVTAETSNASYGAISPCCGQLLTQGIST